MELKEWLAPALEPSVFDYNMAKLSVSPGISLLTQILQYNETHAMRLYPCDADSSW
jgi:hypothetical protein